MKSYLDIFQTAALMHMSTQSYIEENVAIGFAQSDFESFLSLSLSLSTYLSISLSISTSISISRRISESSLDCGVKSITVLMRWHRAYIIFLWISISADTSHRRGSSNEMQMARYVNANPPSGRHGHNEDGVRWWRGHSAMPLRFVRCHFTVDWFVKLTALITKLVLMKPKIGIVLKIVMP